MPAFRATLMPLRAAYATLAAYVLLPIAAATLPPSPLTIAMREICRRRHYALIDTPCRQPIFSFAAMDAASGDADVGNSQRRHAAATLTMIAAAAAAMMPPL